MARIKKFYMVELDISGGDYKEYIFRTKEEALIAMGYFHNKYKVYLSSLYEMVPINQCYAGHRIAILRRGFTLNSNLAVDDNIQICVDGECYAYRMWYDVDFDKYGLISQYVLDADFYSKAQ